MRRGMVQSGAQNALQGRGNARQRVPKPVREPRGVCGEVGVVAVEDAQLIEQLVVTSVEPVHLMAPGAAGVGEHEGVTTVGLGLARIEVGGAAHDQPGHVRDRHTEACSDGEHEAGERAGLVDDQGRVHPGPGRGRGAPRCPPRRWPRRRRTAARPRRPARQRNVLPCRCRGRSTRRCRRAFPLRLLSGASSTRPEGRRCARRHPPYESAISSHVPIRGSRTEQCRWQHPPGPSSDRGH